MASEHNIQINNTLPPPINKSADSAADNRPIKKRRDSNLELYRIIVMIMIVAHHYVVNSGLMQALTDAPLSGVSMTMMLFGAWGKTGINCFVLITGYFMCTSRFSWQKLLKLYLQVTFYSVVIYLIFCLTGHETTSPLSLAKTLIPVHGIRDGFTSCFIVFYLFIPFLNILISHLEKRMHLVLVCLLTTIYTLLPTLRIPVTFNYVTWFMALYIIASYMRLYGKDIPLTHRQWGIATLISLGAGVASVAGIFYLRKTGFFNYLDPYFFISDSNKLLALAIGVCSFMWFKDIRIPYSRFINAVGATTFGVLLIHANSDAMRQWLWRETVDCTGHFGESLLLTAGYATVSVLVIFIVCSGIDWFRGRFIEPWLMKASTTGLHRLRPRPRPTGT